MTLDSSNEVVAILYDIENAPFEMLNYTLGKARRYQPCRTIVVSDWEARPEQKRWEKLLRRPGFTFRQISRRRNAAKGFHRRGIILHQLRSQGYLQLRLHPQLSPAPGRSSPQGTLSLPPLPVLPAG